MTRDYKIPNLYSKTLRGAIGGELIDSMITVRELSQSLRISEKEIVSHLPQIKPT